MGSLIPPAYASTTIDLNSDRWLVKFEKAQFAQRVQDSGGDTYSAKGKYLLVFLSAQNMGKKPANFQDDENFVVLDNQGRTFEEYGYASSTAQSQYNLDSYYNDVQPTFTINTALAFDVAKDAKGLVLQNSPSDGTTQTIFPLGL